MRWRWPRGREASCRNGMHVIRTARLLLTTPSHAEVRVAVAAASDPEAQRWLGWPETMTLGEPERARLLETIPYRWTRVAPSWPAEEHGLLIAIHRFDRRYAGMVGVNQDTHELGGWLVPGYRYQQLGAELFTAGLTLGHHHLALARVRAGTEPGNRACLSALNAAGFAPAPGSADHELPDGRRVPASWHQHEEPTPAHCSGHRRSHMMSGS